MEDPLIIKLDTDIKKTEVYKIMSEDMHELKVGQNDIVNAVEFDRSQNKQAFERGNKKFDDQANEIAGLRSDFSELKEEVNDMNISMTRGFGEVMETIKSKETRELKEQIAGLSNEKLLASERSFTIKSGLILIVATIFFTALFTNLPNISFSKPIELIKKG